MPIGSPTFAVDLNEWRIDLQHENESHIGVNISASGYLDSSPYEPHGDEATQDLLDYLAAWPKLHSNGVTSYRSRKNLYPITVTP